MPVLAKFRGIVIRLLMHRTFGTRLHAFYGDGELVIGLNPVRVIQGDVPPWVERLAMNWARQHQAEFVPAWNLPVILTTRAGSRSVRSSTLSP